MNKETTSYKKGSKNVKIIYLLLLIAKENNEIVFERTKKLKLCQVEVKYFSLLLTAN